jgi:hypothetical protein
MVCTSRFWPGTSPVMDPCSDPSVPIIPRHSLKFLPSVIVAPPTTGRCWWIALICAKTCPSQVDRKLAFAQCQSSDRPSLSKSKPQPTRIARPFCVALRTADLDPLRTSPSKSVARSCREHCGTVVADAGAISIANVTRRIAPGRNLFIVFSNMRNPVTRRDFLACDNGKTANGH